MIQAHRRCYLIQHLLAEHPDGQEVAIPEDPQQQRSLLRALFNIRPAQPVSPAFKVIQDQYLQKRAQQKGIVNERHFQPGLNLWQGDITRLKVDAIVNAANSGLTGCYIPNHNCIDNAIHTFAGVELRYACAQLVTAQGHPEETGQAKITPAFNLPSKYVIHTVGPIVSTPTPTTVNISQLAASYRNALHLATHYHLKSIAFPCISTGVFHFPNQLAAQIAIQTTREFLKEPTTIKKVIFDVFKDNDSRIYQQLLRPNQSGQKI
ncbi:protein-ADP-ribose hydrolase [Limosilactobacillus sp.]|uniref:protein-ADP-ribose hydrolase n=1 Tax=Limosilactobacillus sp. TaxID=2773925 RepID=UPI003F024FA9